MICINFLELFYFIRLYKLEVRKLLKRRENVRWWWKMFSMILMKFCLFWWKLWKFWSYLIRKIWWKLNYMVDYLYWLKKLWKLLWFCVELSWFGLSLRDSWVCMYMKIMYMNVMFWIEMKEVVEIVWSWNGV